MSATVLIVDDEAAARYGIRRALEKEGYSLLEADSIDEAETRLRVNTPEVVILDVKLATESGLDYLPKLVTRNAAPAVIIVTAHGSERTAVEAIKKGAFDYLSKPFEIDELRVTVRNACQSRALKIENERLRIELTGSESFGELIGSSPLMKRVYSMIEKVAQTGVNVLITGESGTGKELVAREVHNRSLVRNGPFVAVNCAAMPTELIESELFGHEKGAFTGATLKRVGKFEAANGGTLFLDEVGDMSLATQAKVLRVLEDKSFQRLGSNTLLKSDARIISATNKNLEEESVAGRFREDLFYRLCVVRLELPPLRERSSDVLQLCETFCRRFSAAYGLAPLRLSKEAARILLSHTWPGNVRELRNCIERAAVLSEGGEITVENLPEGLLGKSLPKEELQKAGNAIEIDFTDDFKAARREFERQYIEKCLALTGGNITRAASMLGMHRQSLQHKLRELGLQKRFTTAS
jgi:DNA-binding NtrC family response regulator